MSDERINNGVRLPVKFGPFEGVAGIALRGGTVEIAFREDLRRMAGTKLGLIDGVPYEVLAIARSDPARGGISGMVVVTARATATTGASEE